tara:strand:+ start:784 stop:984 length:201 start_codon:yes stop_codon:yes gene_type:complete
MIREDVYDLMIHMIGYLRNPKQCLLFALEADYDYDLVMELAEIIDNEWGLGAVRCIKEAMFDDIDE